jgi:hypothetical protein
MPALSFSCLSVASASNKVPSILNCSMINRRVNKVDVIIMRVVRRDIFRAATAFIQKRGGSYFS